MGLDLAGTRAVCVQSHTLPQWASVDTQDMCFCCAAKETIHKMKTTYTVGDNICK